MCASDRFLAGIATVSSTSNFPSELRQKRQTTRQLQSLAPVDTWPTTQETCPKCGAKEVRYTTLQLRSADEGTTLFYYCPDCSERYVHARCTAELGSQSLTKRVKDGTKATKQQSNGNASCHSSRPKTTSWKLVTWRIECVRPY